MIAGRCVVVIVVQQWLIVSGGPEKIIGKRLGKGIGCNRIRVVIVRIPGNHVQVKHAEYFLTLVGCPLGIGITAHKSDLFFVPGRKPYGILRVERSQQARCFQHGYRTGGVVIGAGCNRSRWHIVVVPANDKFLPGISGSGFGCDDVLAPAIAEGMDFRCITVFNKLIVDETAALLLFGLL